VLVDHTQHGAGDDDRPQTRLWLRGPAEWPDEGIGRRPARRHAPSLPPPRTRPFPALAPRVHAATGGPDREPAKPAQPPGGTTGASDTPWLRPVPPADERHEAVTEPRARRYRAARARAAWRVLTPLAVLAALVVLLTSGRDAAPTAPVAGPAVAPGVTDAGSEPAGGAFGALVGADGTIDPFALDAALRQAVAGSLDTFWSRTLPAVYGKPYDKVADVVGYGPGGGTLMCGDRRLTAPARNAVYCAVSDRIAYDRGFMLELVAVAGRTAPAFALAHEWGHAIEHRLGARLTGVENELAADCLAGAWAASPEGKRAVGDRRAAHEAIAMLADPMPSDPSTPGMHGTKFQRTTAFDGGYAGGPLACLARSD